jgi:phospholipid/cholesterol/gamma-HCH transport system ATP-binding protein
MTAESILKVDSIETRFGSNHVHRGVTFEVTRPSVIAIIGGSGCGKSVLLREILGLLRPAAGSISIFGQDIARISESELRELRNRYGVLFQNGALFSALTVGQNVASPLREQTRLPAHLIDSVVELRLALSGLGPETARLMPSELSGGMKKRAALARALALEPEILFLDEPTSGLDPINARSFDELVRSLCDGLALTVVMVTHDLDTLESIIDRVIALADGKVLADGPVHEVARVDHPWIRSYFSARAKSSKKSQGTE